MGSWMVSILAGIAAGILRALSGVPRILLKPMFVCFILFAGIPILVKPFLNPSFQETSHAEDKTQ